MLRFPRLIGLLALVYPGLLLYGSLFPLHGWRDAGVPPLAFLSAPLPRYWTALDLLANVGLYVPLGFVWSYWLLGRRTLQKIWWLAALPALLMSFGVEVVQNWLPSRVSSNLDLACNAFGAVAGVLIARLVGVRWLDRLHDWAAKNFQIDSSGQLGMLLLTLWFIGQWVPDGTVLVSGDWRGWWSAWPPEWAPRFGEPAALQLESMAVAAFLLAVGLTMREILRSPWWKGLAMISLFFLLAISTRAVVAALMVRWAAAFDWLTLGAQSGLLAGSLLLLVAYFLPAAARRWLALLALLAGTLAINLAGPNPYGPTAQPSGMVSAFHNFAGVTGLVALLWPLAALVWWVGRLRRSPIMADRFFEPETP